MGLTTELAISDNRVSASFDSIPPGQQRTIVINANLPATSTAKDGDVVRNTASFSYAGHAAQPSNIVANTFVAPALWLTSIRVPHGC